ncbi:MAG: hypothetical protein IJC33_03850 [Clostridia bacterium]|nr:hypothetical protein [Clostridia bacterium]
MSASKVQEIIIHHRFNRPKTIPWPIGDGTAPIFEETIENGVRVLRETGRDPLNEFVQASLPETLVYNIIARYERGDVAALHRTMGQFIDVVGMPTNLAEAHQAILDIENKFDTLSADVKACFNNNVNEFIDAVANGKLDEKLASFVKKTEPSVDPVKEDVTE